MIYYTLKYLPLGWNDTRTQSYSWCF